MHERSRITLFVGPSAYGMAAGFAMPNDLAVRPPAKRGDIDRLIDDSPPGVVILCDGVFQATPAVSHAEICRAIDGGWQVWGVASLGAIRAHEMRDEGMHGYGWVFDQFKLHEDFRDDEMCVLHLPIAPYEPVTEAMVNIRYALECQGAELEISSKSRRLLLSELRKLWFGDRSFERIAALMTGAANMSVGTSLRLLEWARTNRVKTLDLQSMLRHRPWEN